MKKGNHNLKIRYTYKVISLIVFNTKKLEGPIIKVTVTALPLAADRISVLKVLFAYRFHKADLQLNGEWQITLV